MLIRERFPTNLLNNNNLIWLPIKKRACYQRQIWMTFQKLNEVCNHNSIEVIHENHFIKHFSGLYSYVFNDVAASKSSIQQKKKIIALGT